MIVLGIVAVLIAQKAVLLNGNFANGTVAWTRTTCGAEPSVEVDTKTKHGASDSLRISSTAPTDTALGQVLKVQPGQIYRFSGWVKTADIKPGTSPVYGTIQVQHAPDGVTLASGHNHVGTTDWTREDVYFVGPNDGNIRACLFQFGWGKGIGTTWFSDLTLEPIRPSDSTIRLTKKPFCPGRINPMQYGQFIEYLCDLVPSMWAEKLYDNSFEGLTPYKFHFVAETDFKENPWYPFGQANRLQVSQDSTTFISGKVSKHIVLTDGPRCQGGIAQDGISVEKGQACTFSIFVRGTGGVSHLKVRLYKGSDEISTATLPVTKRWQKVSTSLIPRRTTDNASLAIEFTGPGSWWLENASLMPKSNIGGWRPDVVKALTALKPGVIRVGGSVLDDANLGTFEWTDTIGDPDHRTPFAAWGGMQPMGAGLEEVVQLIQTVKAEPLICVRYEKKTPKDAANEVEYFNGSIETPMGAQRAKNGHPKPYGIKYWQIGNERWGEEYWKAVPEFCKAMLAVDPKIELLSSFPSDALIKGAAPYLSYVSPHQYDVENLSGTLQELAQTRSMIARSGGGKELHVAVTEWNTTAGDIGLPRAKLWSLKNALDCSRYQNLLHRQADLVAIANRSNLANSFCSGIIQTNRASMFLTPTYYAQSLYANCAGTRPLKIESALPADLSPDLSATLSEDGRWLTLFAVNQKLNEVPRTIDLSEFINTTGEADVWTLGDTKLADEPDVFNSFLEPKRIVPVKSTFKASLPKFNYTFPPLTLTVLRWRVNP